MSETTTVRSSSLSGYADCPRRAATRIFKREIEGAGYRLTETPWGIGGAVGTAVHSAAALELTEKAKSGALPPVSVPTDAAVESLHEAIRRGITFDKTTNAEDRAEKTVIGMVGGYHGTIAPHVEPILIEERLEADVGNGLILSGQADLVAREHGAIRDLKTGTRRGNHKPQIGSYSLLARSHGIEIAEAREDFIRRVGPKTEQPAPISYAHDVGAAETAALSILHRIAADIKTFREGDGRILPGDPWAFPANPSSVLCSAKYCPAHGTAWCIEHKTDEQGVD